MAEEFMDIRNRKRTKAEQQDVDGKTLTKRRVNITITGEYWDKLEAIGVENKSKMIEEHIKQLIAEAEAEDANQD